jgi:hypothetical protein
MWTKEYPTEDGKFWFYGRPFGPCSHPRLCMVCCFRDKTRLRILVCDGSFMYESESEGVFMPADVPELPTEEEMTP